MSRTTARDFDVTLVTGRSLEEKLSSEVISAKDYGAAAANSATANSAAINLAILAAEGVSGFVLVTPDISYVETLLSIPDGVVVLVLTTNGTLICLTKDQGTTLPVTKGGIAVKAQGHTGILIRAIDGGVSTEPICEFLDLTSGDIAGIHTKFAELDEIAPPAAPAANKVRIFAQDNGSGATQLVARFPSGNDIPLATQNTNSGKTANATYDPASIADGAGVTTTVSLSGAALGDMVAASFSVDLQGIILSAWVSAPNVVSVRFQNETGGALDLASGTLTVRIL